jgi:hypothetical protein
VIKSDFAKLVIAIALDIADFTIGRLLGVGMIMDVVFAAVAFALWGPIGLIALWESLDPSEQIDGFVPTMTLIAISQMGRSKKKSAPEPLEPPRR